MTKLRQTIAKRLKGAQETAAILTTFNEVDMGAIMALRKQYQDNFVKKHDVKLGFMSFFVKAVVQFVGYVFHLLLFVYPTILHTCFFSYNFSKAENQICS